MTTAGSPTRELLVLRHAKSAWDTGAPSDYERPLAPRGEGDCPRIGAWIADHELVPDLIWSSPARRARQTIESVCAAMGFDRDEVRFEQRLYLAGLGALLDVLASTETTFRRVMVVGHNPGLEDLVFYLARSDVDVPPNGKIMPTAALAHFRLPEDWNNLANGCGELETLVRPKALRKRAS
jgi:phosphohistidine phosphatase